MNTSNKDDQNKVHHLNTAHYLTESYSNSLCTTFDIRAIGNIAPIWFRLNIHFVVILYFFCIDYREFFKKSEERLKNEKGSARENLSLNISQILTTSQQNPLSEENSYLDSLFFTLKDLLSKKLQSINLTFFYLIWNSSSFISIEKNISLFT